MRDLRVFSLFMLPLLSIPVMMSACSSDSSNDNGTDGGSPLTDASPAHDAANQDASPSDGSSGLTVTPATANLLTCHPLQFKETGGAGGGTWTAAPAGKIDAASGLYSAPLTAAAGMSSVVTYTESYADGGSASASGNITLATAFLGPIATLPTNANPDSAGTHSPFEHTFTANGSRIYSAIQRAPVAGGALLEADLYVSSDSGKTFTAGAVYHTGNLTANCITTAVDAGDPDVVYLTYYAGHGDSTSNTGNTVRLAVSQDGGKTFPTEYIVADNTNSFADFICPDVISPSADHVIVSGIATTSNTSWAATFVSGNRGSSIGPVGTEGVSSPANPADPSGYYAVSDTNSSSAKTGCTFSANGGNKGPRVSTNGAGNVCVTYSGTSGDCNGVFVQCSADNGATWTATNPIATPTANTGIFSAVSKSGNVALTWLDTVASATEVMLAISRDGGKTFGAPFQYPSSARNGVVPGAYTYDPVVTWESDDILWLSQTLDGSDSPVLMADKTCDFGTSWSGAVNVGPYKGTSLLFTANGMVATGYGKGTTNVVTIPLAQNAQ